MKLSNECNKKILEMAEGSLKEIQPIVENTGSQFMDLAKEVVMSEISNLFTKGYEKMKERKENLNVKK